MNYIVEDIICSEFERNIGRWQCKEEKQHAMKLTFRLSVDYDVEEGYRHLDILIFADANYVTVAARERWNVIPLVDLQWDEKAQEHFIRKGKDYRDGDNGWKLCSHHDSCWRDGVSRLMKDDRIAGIDYILKGWYEKIEVDNELLETIHKIQGAHNNKLLYYPDKGVLHFTNKGEEYLGKGKLR